MALAERSGVDMPLTAAVAAITTGELSPRLVFDALMRRDATVE
jgi:glycerol-3-phosphate dehydrogenase